MAWRAAARSMVAVACMAAGAVVVATSCSPTASNAPTDRAAGTPAVAQGTPVDSGTKLPTSKVDDPVKPPTPPVEKTPLVDKPPIDQPPSPPSVGPAAKVTAPPSTDKLFVDWPKKLKTAIVVTGLQQGYIEPCGCTGLANQKGGLMRRHTLLKQIQAEFGCEVVPLDVGEIVRRFGRQQEIKYSHTARALRTMGYRAVGFGPSDLRLTTGEVLSSVVGDDPGARPMFISANVGLDSFDEGLVPFHTIVETGGLRIGVTSVLGQAEYKKISNPQIKFKPAAAALPPVVAKLKEKPCDLLVLLANCSMEETKELAGKFPEFDIVVTTGGADEPTLRPETLRDGAGLLVETGHKGMYVGVIGVADQPARKNLHYQLVPLDDRFKDSPEMVKIMSEYQLELRELWQQGLTAYGLKEREPADGRTYVGSKKCGECHTKAYAIWEKTPHAHGTESLVHPPERGEIARHFDAECLSCHATGWVPQDFEPYRTGFSTLEKTPLLTGSGCENCHGPGSKHVAAESDGANEKLLARLRDSMKLPLAKAEQHCATCHDLDNSPDFQKDGAFEKYWKKIEHIGKD